MIFFIFPLLLSYFSFFFSYSYLVLSYCILVFLKEIYKHFLLSPNFSLKFLESLEVRAGIKFYLHFDFIVSLEKELIRGPSAAYLAGPWFVSDIYRLKRTLAGEWSNHMMKEFQKLIEPNLTENLKIKETQLLLASLNHLFYSGILDREFNEPYQEVIDIYTGYSDEGSKKFSAYLNEARLELLERLKLFEQEFDKLELEFLQLNKNFEPEGLLFLRRLRYPQNYIVFFNLIQL